MENLRGHEKRLYFLKPYTRDREHAKKRFRMRQGIIGYMGEGEDENLHCVAVRGNN